MNNYDKYERGWGWGCSQRSVTPAFKARKENRERRLANKRRK